MFDQFCQFVAPRPQVFARVEFSWVLGQHLAHGGRDSQSAIAVNVDLANGAAGGPPQLNLRYANGSFHVTTVEVYHLNVLRHHRRGSVEHDRKAW